ncbi:MAG TPA: HAMP domain-containing sensor histidine kinase, partial [Acidobacteriaceae bacterium]|nr:HAMP domain-containing sensor histidine kinase [Acidobacteriaceae bacterium]
PVILIGGRPSQTESLRTLREGATDYLSNTELEYLPTVLARALKVRESNSVHARTQSELDRAAAMLRENQKLITIGRLAALISHEINNPLEAVTNLLYLVSEEKDLPDRAKEYLSLAQRELERVGQISRQTLNFSRETTTPVSTHIDELMEEVLTLYGRRIADKSLQVDRQYSCPGEALVFPGEMRQVLSNLITNAIEASSTRGRLRVRIRCARNWSDPGVRGIRISVGDTGTGIPAEVQRRLGEPFFTTKGQRGTGLGLWVTRSIIQRYGGDIHLRSSTARHRHGTVFSIFLPTNMRPTVVGKDFDSDDGGSGSGSPKLRPLTTSGISRNRAATNETRRKFVTELPPHRRASGD